MQTFQADLAIIGAGGAGLRAAIAAAQANPNAKIALISKVYPMRSHTVAAEGGSAAVAQDHDSFDYHFHDTVAGGDWLCEQDVVDYFVHHCPTEMTQLEQWGCPWSRRPDGSVNVRHLGEKKLHERLPFICELAKAYVGVDPVKEPIPVRPTAHYTMGGIETDQNCESRVKGLFAVGECSSVGLHGANRLGSNSLAELVVFGRLAGEQAMERAATAGAANSAALDAQVADIEQRLKNLVNQEGNENWSKIRDEMGLSMEEGCGIYRTPELMQKTVDKLAELQERFKRVRISDTSSVFNTDLLYTIELGHGLNVAECMAHSALARKESRGAHQRLDEGCTERDDVNFLKHTLAFRDADGTTRLEYSDVKITTLPPAKRVYGGEAEAADKKEKANG
ncbi:TPA_asm: FAD-binding protein [Salmonella enterica subsp. enterica serovar Typhimurium]|nr:FAD-binding protein [Salmonella enterica subsp. enterica serovar Typhimurium]